MTVNYSINNFHIIIEDSIDINDKNTLNINCIILHMVKLFHIKIRKISFCHNSSVKINNPNPPNVILTLSMATWVCMSPLSLFLPFLSVFLVLHRKNLVFLLLNIINRYVISTSEYLVFEKQRHIEIL